jgi:hypothetical protein
MAESYIFEETILRYEKFHHLISRLLIGLFDLLFAGGLSTR